jgi:hypothetical protein
MVDEPHAFAGRGADNWSRHLLTCNPLRGWATDPHVLAPVRHGVAVVVGTPRSTALNFDQNAALATVA